MRFPWLILIFVFIPFITLAQYGIITGKVTHEGSPLPRASVFLSNSSVGSATLEDGSFTLSGIRQGQYTLVVTILGYQDYSKTILVGTEPIKLNIEMTQKPLELRTVVISSAADWKKNYEAFRKEFIGSDENAKYCTILNPHILNLEYNQTKQLLHADADEFLIVENKALGYRVKFLLNDFKIDKIANLISREGQQVFEDLPGSDAQKKKWHEKREEAYYGSAMHFYRSLYTEKLAQEGFILYHLTRSLDPERPSDEVLKQKFQYFKIHGMVDSAKNCIYLSTLPKYHNQNLMKPPLHEFEVLTSGAQRGLYAMHYTNYLYVVYTKKTDDTPDKDLYRDLNQSNYAVSIITMTAPYVEFDMNGIVVDNAPIYEGAWSRNRLSDMLPVDYVPDQK